MHDPSVALSLFAICQETRVDAPVTFELSATRWLSRRLASLKLRDLQFGLRHLSEDVRCLLGDRRFASPPSFGYSPSCKTDAQNIRPRIANRNAVMRIIQCAIRVGSISIRLCELCLALLLLRRRPHSGGSRDSTRASDSADCSILRTGKASDRSSPSPLTPLVFSAQGSRVHRALLQGTETRPDTSGSHITPR